MKGYGKNTFRGIGHTRFIPTKVAIGAALIVGAAVATVATGGVACFAAGAAIGAAKGAVSGAIGGAITGAIQSRIETGSWDGALEAAVDGAADGFLGGAIGGFITGGITSKHCFVAGTLIHTEDGLVPIEEINANVLSYPCASQRKHCL